MEQERTKLLYVPGSVHSKDSARNPILWELNVPQYMYDDSAAKDSVTPWREQAYVAGVRTDPIKHRQQLPDMPLFHIGCWDPFPVHESSISVEFPTYIGGFSFLFLAPEGPHHVEHRQTSLIFEAYPSFSSCGWWEKPPRDRAHNPFLQTDLRGRPWFEATMQYRDDVRRNERSHWRVDIPRDRRYPARGFTGIERMKDTFLACIPVDHRAELNMYLAYANLHDRYARWHFRRSEITYSLAIKQREKSGWFREPRAFTRWWGEPGKMVKWCPSHMYRSCHQKPKKRQREETEEEEQDAATFPLRRFRAFPVCRCCISSEDIWHCPNFACQDAVRDLAKMGEGRPCEWNCVQRSVHLFLYGSLGEAV